MESEIFSLVYVSSASWLLDDAELDAILCVSRINNHRDGISGMLLYRGGNFMQVLEGAEDKVQGLIDKLQQDPRHHGLEVLIEDRIKERQFEKWAMAFPKLDLSARENVEGLSNFFDDESAAAPFRSTPAKAYRLLLSFRNNIK